MLTYLSTYWTLFDHLVDYNSTLLICSCPSCKHCTCDWQLSDHQGHVLSKRPNQRIVFSTPKGAGTWPERCAAYTQIVGKHQYWCLAHRRGTSKSTRVFGGPLWPYVPDAEMCTNLAGVVHDLCLELREMLTSVSGMPPRGLWVCRSVHRTPVALCTERRKVHEHGWHGAWPVLGTLEN